MSVVHASDCAIYNAPALPVGPCDCGAVEIDMSRKQYAEDCPGCRPVAIDFATGKPLPDDHPMMRTLAKVWQETGPLHKAAFHRVTCLSSTSMLDLALAREYMAKVQALAKELPDADDTKH